MKKFINHILFLLIFLLTAFISNAQEKKNNKVTTEFEVSGVCDMCKKRIENAALIKGVKYAEWDKKTGIITVIYDDRKTTNEAIQEAIAEHGHDTPLAKADSLDYKKLPDCCYYRDDVEVH